MYYFLEAFGVFFPSLPVTFDFCILYVFFLSQLPSKLTPMLLFILLGEVQAILPPIHSQSPLGYIQRHGSLDTDI